LKKSPQEKGRDFEREMADEYGLQQVPGSGNQWHSKLDVAGSKVRWSLKFTEGDSFKLSKEFIREAVDATQGLSGSGELPLWGIRLGDSEYDLVVIRRRDFNTFVKGEIKFTSEKRKGTAIRTRMSDVPSLLRDEDDLNHDED